MSRYNKNLGDFGEEAARSFLENKGYKILKRNYCVKGGEIDIICTDGNTMVFVEVKTRKTSKFGEPADAVDMRKLSHMKTAAERYYASNPFDGEVRFDVVEVYAAFDSSEASVEKIRHIPDITID